MNAGRLALERAKHEFIAPEYVYAQPVNVVERVIKECHEVGRICKRISFIAQLIS